ncbi:MAG: radical SAM protein [Deltaproteobacteria bacterium]|nr:radical SAM protein [Deltaproteobacteria bacterium]
MDEYRIDSHKLIYHPRRVAEWLMGEDVYPIYAELSPIGACNHRCTYCGLDYMGYNPRHLDAALLKTRLTEMAGLGLKSVMYAGEGEPFLHKDIAGIINHTKAAGIDVAVTSNGVLFTEPVCSMTLPSITWIKISCNAATPKTYAAIHRTKEEDFGRVIKNVSGAVKMRSAEGIPATIGMQLILLPENVGEAVELARIAKEIGADYLVIKSYSQHLKSITRKYQTFKYGDYLRINEELQRLSGNGFQVIFRENAMRKLEETRRKHERCLALPFWTYIDAGGGVWGCSAYLGDERFLYGNINETPFERIWKGAKRTEIKRLAADELDTNQCRVNCRMDEVNRYLWDLAHPGAHVNFI